MLKLLIKAKTCEPSDCQPRRLQDSEETTLKPCIEPKTCTLGCPQLGHVPKSLRRRSFSISDNLLTTFLGIGTLRSYPKLYRQLTVNSLNPLKLGKKCHLSRLISQQKINQFSKNMSTLESSGSKLSCAMFPDFHSFIRKLHGTTLIIQFSRKIENKCITYQVSYLSKNLIDF